MAGVDIPDKLRRALGNGKPIPWEQVAKLIAPFDADKDGAITKAEYSQFLAKSGVGGRWFCDLVAKVSWTMLEANFSEPVAWVKIELAAVTVAEFMKLRPRPPKRVAITPAGAQGWEPLYHLDGTPLADADGKVPDVPPGPNRLARSAPVSTASPTPVSPQKFKANNEPFTRPPAAAAARSTPTAAPRPGPRPSSPPSRPVTSSPAAAPPRTPTAAPASRPGPRRPGPRR